MGHGGITYIASVLGCAQSTISNGIKELLNLAEDSGYDPRIRKPGAGRKRYDQTHPAIDAAFLEVLKEHTAGDPMREAVLWTNLTQQEIAERLASDHGIQVSTTVIDQLLKRHNYRRRKAKKKSP